MADKKFSELITAATVTDSGILAMSQDLNGSLASQKTTVGAVGTHIAKEMNFTADLQTTSKNIIGAINEAATSGGDTVTVTNTITPTTTTKKVADVNINSVANSIYADDAEKVLRQAFGEHTVTGNPITFDAYLGVEVAKSCEVTFSPIQSGSGEPSPINIRPISGRDSLDLGVNGVNQWDEEWELGTYNTTTGEKSSSASNIRSKNKIPIVSGAAYRFVIPTGITMRYLLYYKDESYSELTGTRTNGGTLEIPAGIGFMTFHLNAGTTYNNDISINYPATDTEYHAYNGQTHTATFSETEYGGSYEFVSGKGKSEWTYIASYNGETITEPWISDRDVYVAGTTPSIGAEVCYKLANPTTITLTPEEIELLSGDNVLWTDGDNIEITYKKLLLPSDVESLSKIKKIEEKPKTTRSKKKKEE